MKCSVLPLSRENSTTIDSVIDSLVFRAGFVSLNKNSVNIIRSNVHFFSARQIYVVVWEAEKPKFSHEIVKALSR